MNNSGLVNEDNIIIGETKATDNYYVMCSNLSQGSYEMIIESIKLNRNYNINDAPCGNIIQGALVNLYDNTVECSRFFMSEYGEPQEWFFVVPENEQANYAIVIYDGFNNDTYGNFLEMSNVRVDCINRSSY